MGRFFNIAGPTLEKDRYSIPPLNRVDGHNIRKINTLFFMHQNITLEAK
ncbi:MAG TPA: hypothetical protein HPP56_06825 [Nitrospirae bacterium]|nr:hypothetical protein [Nitrospirota bacterium]